MERALGKPNGPLLCNVAMTMFKINLQLKRLNTYSSLWKQADANNMTAG